jgi:hypothetical protein
MRADHRPLIAARVAARPARWLAAAISASLLLLAAALPGAARAGALEGVLSPGALIQGHAKAEADCDNCHLPFKKTGQDELCAKCHKDVGKDLDQKAGFHGRIKDRGLCRSCHADHKGRTAKVVVLDEPKFNHEQTNFVLKDSHQKVKCDKCHAPGAKHRDAKKTCVGCHKKDDDAKGHKGSLGDKCQDCHTVKKWKDTFFDHDKTKFPLRDAHADPKVACKACHANNRYKNTPVNCYACHKKDDDDPKKHGHHGKYGEKCEKCHAEKKWDKPKFDHDRDTKYALRFKHAEAKVKCKDCHTTEYVYRDKLKQDCIACHKKDDKHKGTEGDKCEKCHSERSWKETHDFDHDKTKFPLRESHADKKVKCEDCHKTKVYTDAPKNCYACHKKDDEDLKKKGHRGKYGEKCEACHTEAKFDKPKFDHDRDTKYRLLGKHRDPKVKCKDCHTTEYVYKDKLKQDCIACHKKDDKHKGKEGDKCEDCHVEQNWKTTKSKFDHDLTVFPLLGKHVKVDCNKCHITLEFKDAKTACVACHQKDDQHKGRLGTVCEDCHNAVSWKRWDFNHDTRTRFKLDGAHAKVDCYACHRLPVKGRALLPMACVACHENDDAHAGSFGRQCERCHVTSVWTNIKGKVSLAPSAMPAIASLDGGVAQWGVALPSARR